MSRSDSEANASTELDRVLVEGWHQFPKLGGLPATRRDLQPIAREAARLGHMADLLPEQLILAIKESWSTEGRHRRTAERFRMEWIVTEVISLTIQEYYRAAGQTDGEPAGPVSRGV